MFESGRLPNSQKLSLLIATILLAFVIARFVQDPGLPIDFTFAGIYIPLNISLAAIIAVIVAILTASGTDWLLRDYQITDRGALVQHWVLPGLTAWVIGFPLRLLPISPLWWAGFASAGIILLLVITAEYVASNPDDIRQPFAAAGLIALSYMLFLILIITLRTTSLRLIFFLPTVGLSVGLVIMRALHLRLHGSWLYPQAVAGVLLVVQFAAALHYLPLSPISVGLFLLGLLYAYVNFVVNFSQTAILRQALSDSVFVIAVLWALALLLR